MRQTTSLGRAYGLALLVAVALAPACGSSQHGDDDDDDDGGSSGESGENGVRGGSSGKSATSAGKGGAAARGGTSSGGTSGGTHEDTSGAPGSGEAGAEALGGGTTSVGGTSGGGTGGSSAAAGASGGGPRPAFAPKIACDAPRWLTTVAQPLEGSDPVAVTNGLGVFMVTWLISEEVNATETWANTVVSMDRGGLYPNPLDNDAGEGTNTHTGQLAMGKTGDAIWVQNPGILGSSATTTLRRWDQTATAWDEPHLVTGMRPFGMRATFLDDHDILVVGSIDDQLVAVVYDDASATWSEPEPVGSLGSTLPNWGITRIAVAADEAGNAAVAWANSKASGARLMRGRTWVGSTVPLSDDAMVQDFWDVAVVPAGGGKFEVVAGPQDETRGVVMQSRTLDYASGTGTVLGEIVELGRMPQSNYIGAGQPITALRDIDGDLTVGSVFWTDHPEFWAQRRVKGVWATPERLATGNIVGNDGEGMALRSIALDAGGHALAVTANEDDELMLREAEKGSLSWTEGIRIDTADFRFNRRGVSLVLDGDEPVIFFSADDALGTRGNVAWTACHK